MSVTFTKKVQVLRTRAAKRRQALKVKPIVKGKKVSQMEANHAVIKALEAKIAK
jgi:hypothetical protein